MTELLVTHDSARRGTRLLAEGGMSTREILRPSDGGPCGLSGRLGEGDHERAIRSIAPLARERAARTLTPGLTHLAAAVGSQPSPFFTSRMPLVDPAFALLVTHISTRWP